VHRRAIRDSRSPASCARKWEQALAALSPVPESSDERASADDFMAELKRDPSLLVRDRGIVESATGGVQ